MPTREGCGGRNRTFADFIAYWEWFKAEPETYLDAVDHVVTLGTYSGRAKESGGEFEAPFAHVWKMRSGKAVVLRQYTDTARIVGALKGEPAAAA